MGFLFKGRDGSSGGKAHVTGGLEGLHIERGVVEEGRVEGLKPLQDIHCCSFLGLHFSIQIKGCFRVHTIRRLKKLWKGLGTPAFKRHQRALV